MADLAHITSDDSVILKAGVVEVPTVIFKSPCHWISKVLFSGVTQTVV